MRDMDESRNARHERCEGEWSHALPGHISFRISVSSPDYTRKETYWQMKDHTMHRLTVAQRPVSVHDAGADTQIGSECWTRTCGIDSTIPPFLLFRLEPHRLPRMPAFNWPTLRTDGKSNRLTSLTCRNRGLSPSESQINNFSIHSP
jgi:hypothetical protein